jgi:leader peptidase (prepilin peptidase)/N-methyltransferase
MGGGMVESPWGLLSAVWLHVPAAIIGACLGSFGNVLVWRLPRGESIAKPPSHCPECGQRIRFYDNIPVLSYIWLRGRCRDCGAPISIRYPLLELACAVLFVGAALAFGWSLGTLFYGLFLIALLVLAIIDIEHWLLPFAITVPMTALGLIAAAVGATLPLVWALAGAALGLLFFLGVTYVGRSVLKREAMGGGDVVFGLMAGMYLGVEKTIVMIFLASLLGTLVSAPLLIARRKRGSDPIPFGPFLSVAAAVAVFFGDGLVTWYIGLFW